MKKICFAILCVVVLAVPARALIVWDNGVNETTYNTTTAGMPVGLDAYWNSVVSISGSAATYGASAVYLGNGCFLTANHVNIGSGAQVKIDGVNYYLDTNFGTNGVLNVSDLPGVTDTVDLKIVRILDSPDRIAVSLNESSNDTARASFIVGYGLGKGTEIAGQGWQWGGDATRTKRWGYSMTDSSVHSFEGTGESLATFFWTGYGTNVAQGTNGDSGGALFQNIAGEWVLSGIAVSVTANGSSYYANPSFGNQPDYTIYVRISNYAGAIKAAIIPEPATVGLAGTSVLALLLLRRRISKTFRENW